MADIINNPSTNNPNPTNNGWSKWEKFILAKLEDTANYSKETRDKMEEFCKESRDRSASEYKELSNMISDLKSDISALKVKAGIWGAAAGAIPVTISLIVWKIQQLFGK